MSDQNPRPLQLFVRLLDGRSTILTFSSPHAYGHQIKQRIFELTKIPTYLQRLICGGYQIPEAGVVSLRDSTVNLVLSLRGGKGGFGSLLRGAATKAGQKKTNNFDACRDMSGRRLRHVNAEKKLEEWKAEEEDRKLEKLAQEFLKKQSKKGKQGVGNGEAQKYVEKYRQESDKCIEAVEMALKESFQSGKRKGKMDAASEKSKRLKIWMGKRDMGDSDSDDSSGEEGDEDDEKSVVLDNGSHVLSDKDTEGSSDSVMVRVQDGESSGRASCESSSEEEKDSDDHQRSYVSMERSSGAEAEEKMKNASSMAISGEAGQAEKEADLSGERSKNELAVASQPLKPSSSNSTDEKPLNFDDFSWAADMEVLGMERLKTELQARGLKCGGTLQERAARLFLLKSTPIDQIPKKLLAKK